MQNNEGYRLRYTDLRRKKLLRSAVAVTVLELITKQFINFHSPEFAETVNFA
ncbi:hypothetical protein J4444_01055 [Candidatus Woesearchaeota archaeon]|nr:hypothetical protein [Candidatus Woesearchaeota archaeon]HLC86642.1 hypothetical protein [Candidatus Nanoarchaeia archaeon]